MGLDCPYKSQKKTIIQDYENQNYNYGIKS